MHLAHWISNHHIFAVLETQYSGDSILLIFPDGTSPALLSCLIAGIPLKDVHALNFEPGEVRLDVTMDSTLELLKDKIASPKYNEMLAAGEKQLETLRKELILKQADENAPPKPAPVSRPSTTTKAAAKRLDLTERDGPDIYPIGAMAAIGYMTLMKKGKDGDSDANTENIINPATTLAYANSTGSTSFEFQARPSETRGTTSNAPNTRTYYTGSNMIEVVPVLSKEERIKAADEAMEEYLNKDDGGDDWLTSMKDIMDE